MNYLMLHRVLGLALIAIADPPSPTILKRKDIYAQGVTDYVIPPPGNNDEVPDQVIITYYYNQSKN